MDGPESEACCFFIEGTLALSDRVYVVMCLWSLVISGPPDNLSAGWQSPNSDGGGGKAIAQYLGKKASESFELFFRNICKPFP